MKQQQKLSIHKLHSRMKRKDSGPLDLMPVLFILTAVVIAAAAVVDKNQNQNPQKKESKKTKLNKEHSEMKQHS
ncbi:hypothetical protein DERP_014107 [Dermatophagoides pteronyssinus]|uniref:Uncharacterized protein n=1 Tax=Dermatophagoides pteronyssinus TaxID=6956 RepID=A0ABQ8IX82_DERPT|nr:hypothetical protein DERP_014107 [Dermatophagoides pteronyssinus]